MSLNIECSPEHYESLGRRLAAAYISWHMGYKGVDHTLRKYETHDINQSWIDLGKQLYHHVQPIGNTYRMSQDPTRKPGLTLVK